MRFQVTRYGQASCLILTFCSCSVAARISIYFTKSPKPIYVTFKTSYFDMFDFFEILSSESFALWTITHLLICTQSVQVSLGSEDIHRIDKPARSPVLNPIENYGMP